MCAEDMHRTLTVIVTNPVRSLLGDDSGGDLDPAGALMDKGLDSLGATQLTQQLEASVGIRLSSTLLFSYPSIDALTGHFLSLLSSSSNTSRHQSDDHASSKRQASGLLPGARISSSRQWSQREAAAQMSQLPEAFPD
jgi:acyl carrier protein